MGALHKFHLSHCSHLKSSPNCLTARVFFYNNRNLVSYAKALRLNDT